MIIKQIESKDNLPSLTGDFPSQFVAEKTKLEDESHIKNTLDWFAHIAFAQYKKNRETFAGNYNLLKGIISWKDFYYSEEPVVKDFFSQLESEQKLPEHIKHYPIMNRPVNTMVGELTKRPDNHRVRAFDDDSRAEELEYKTQLVQQLIMQQVRNQIMQEHLIDGTQLSEEDLEDLTVEKVQDYITDYTSLAERWGNHVLQCMKAELGMKDKGEDAFRDLLIASREFFHIYENNSKRGFDVKVANTKNVIHSTSNDRKYSRDWYYGGILEVMEISEIMDEIPGITKEEIDHLVSQTKDGRRLTPPNSNFDSNQTGIGTIKFSPYYRLVEQERDFLAAELEIEDNGEGLDELAGGLNSNNTFSQKFAVLRMYWLSKKKIGKLTYVDEDGTLQEMLVDESYQEGSPNEYAIEWDWVNQWYQGIRIGTEVYIVRPFKLLDYCPIIGVTHEIKNTQAKSLVDMIKPFQSIYNVCLNQLWEILEKEKGNTLVVNIRRIPIPKDGDNQDAISQWEAEAEQRGIVFEDDSPENMRVPSNNTNLTRNIDLNRSKEIESRIKLAEWAKEQAMSLVGMSEQRMGQVQATETATGTETALAQSFAQTEPYFAQHEYVMDQVYQAILDTCQYIESNKPQSTINYITAAGESMFMQVTPQDIKLRDLHVFSTSRTEDVQLFREIRALAQPMLQNGASTYEVIELYSTNSIRQMKQAHKKLKERKEQMEDMAQQLEQQKMEQAERQHRENLQELARQHQLDIINENINKELDRKNKLEVAIVNAMGNAKDISGDANSDGVADIYQTQDLLNQYDAQLKQHEANLAKLSLERDRLVQEGQFRKKELEQRDREIQNQKKNDQNDLKISQMKIQQEKIKLQAAKYKAQEARNKPKPAAKK